MVVTVSAETPLGRSIRATLRQLAERSVRFREFAEQQLDELDQWRLDLEARERTLFRQQDEFDHSQRALELEWDRLETLRQSAEQGALQVQSEARRLAKLQAEFQASCQEAGRDGNAAARKPPDDRVECDVLRAEIETLCEERRQHQRLAADLAKVQRELLRARGEVERLRQRLSVARGHILPSLSDELRELSDLRSRVQAETLEAQRLANEALAQERERWLEELSSLRAAIEQQLHRGTVPCFERNNEAEAEDCQSVSRAAISEPVLDMVIAQFEQLERDMQRPCASRGPPRSRR